MSESEIAAAIRAGLDWYGEVSILWLFALSFAVGIAGGGWIRSADAGWALWIGYALAAAAVY